MNQCFFSGNLGSDATVSIAASGATLTKFSLGVSISRKGELGTMWVRCTAFGKTGESAAPYLRKGHRAVVSGRLLTDTYTSRDGKDRTELELVASSIEVISHSTEASPQLAAFSDAP
jgi:single-strand DNA-binding protein